MILNKKMYLFVSVALVSSSLVAQKITDYIYPFKQKGRVFDYENAYYIAGDSTPQINYFDETLTKTFIKDGCYAFEVKTEGNGVSRTYYKADKSFKKIFKYATINNKGEYKEDSIPALFAWLPDNIIDKKKWTENDGEIICKMSTYFDSVKVGSNSYKPCLALTCKPWKSVTGKDYEVSSYEMYFIKNIGFVGGGYGKGSIENEYDDGSGKYDLIDTLWISNTNKNVDKQEQIDGEDGNLPPPIDLSNQPKQIEPIDGKYTTKTDNTGYVNGDNTSSIFTIVQQKPVFPGDINKYLADHVIYPQQAKDANIEGTVYMSFVVEKDGSISGITVLRGVNKYLDAEATRVVTNMPKWVPGQQNGHTVRAQYMIPIHFTIK